MKCGCPSVGCQRLRPSDLQGELSQGWSLIIIFTPIITAKRDCESPVASVRTEDGCRLSSAAIPVAIILLAIISMFC
ncbi:protein of unknown function [Acidithiobacillus ferrivorans]|uniref:Uncharacterized protein n=1 Tax=Acidithiobacillus ferrivorans TaxID=160808 RepID=A0A060UXE6_9PROT|nr:hypothetical protein AFERRI_530298 [Acidithiobacillus ferrivorans]SMH67763.1 protein of unknown function [Acidithiobacillus ferrivorans]